MSSPHPYSAGTMLESPGILWGGNQMSPTFSYVPGLCPPRARHWTLYILSPKASGTQYSWGVLHTAGFGYYYQKPLYLKELCHWEYLGNLAKDLPSPFV